MFAKEIYLNLKLNIKIKRKLKNSEFPVSTKQKEHLRHSFS